MIVIASQSVRLGAISAIGIVVSVFETCHSRFKILILPNHHDEECLAA